MRDYDVQSIDLDVDRDAAFDFIADVSCLPRWTSAFAEVSGGRAVMRTPAGEAEVELEVAADRARGTVDWIMTFADGSKETAYSRLVARDGSRTIFSFVLLPPQAALEELEGGLEQQAATLAEELARLKRELEA